METGLDRVESSRPGRSHGDHLAQLGLELLAQPWRHRVVTLQRLGHILPDGGVVRDSHRLRPVSARVQNSASGSG